MKSSDEQETVPIGSLAERFGLATHVLRHWESMGLLQPQRDRSGRRRYTHDHFVRVAVILRAKEAGLGLDAIRDMMTASGPVARRTTLLRERDALLRHIAEAQAALDLLLCALDCEYEDFTTCPHFQQLIADRIGRDTPRHVPVS
ncbi:MerR family transcriptional regulator [Streptomyces sp. NPDC005004]